MGDESAKVRTNRSFSECKCLARTSMRCIRIGGGYVNGVKVLRTGRVRERTNGEEERASDRSPSGADAALSLDRCDIDTSCTFVLI